MGALPSPPLWLCALRGLIWFNSICLGFFFRAGGGLALASSVVVGPFAELILFNFACVGLVLEAGGGLALAFSLVAGPSGR